jgi:hypothetical protein
MGTVVATRGELLVRCARAATARHGHLLLAQERLTLIADLRQVGLQAGEQRAGLALCVREDHRRHGHRFVRDDDDSADTTDAARKAQRRLKGTSS